MRDARTLRLAVLAALLGGAGAGLSSQSPEVPAPQAPPTSIRTAPTDAETSAWRTKLPWLESSEGARTPRMRGRLYHQEYLSRVTPEPFRRSATGAAPGMGTDPGKALNRLRSARRGRQERLMRERVEEELAAMLAGPD